MVSSQKRALFIYLVRIGWRSTGVEAVFGSKPTWAGIGVPLIDAMGVEAGKKDIHMVLLPEEQILVRPKWRHSGSICDTNEPVLS